MKARGSGREKKDAYKLILILQFKMKSKGLSPLLSEWTIKPCIYNNNKKN